MEKPSRKSCVRKISVKVEQIWTSKAAASLRKANQQLIYEVVYTRPLICVNFVLVSAAGKVRCSHCEAGYHFKIGACVLDGGVNNL